MYNYTLQNHRQLDDSFRYRSNNNFCTRFRKSLTFDFVMVSHYFLCVGLIYAEVCRL